jgi:hypothetical protein
VQLEKWIWTARHRIPVAKSPLHTQSVARPESIKRRSSIRHRTHQARRRSGRSSVFRPPWPDVRAFAGDIRLPRHPGAMNLVARHPLPPGPLQLGQEVACCSRRRRIRQAPWRIYGCPDNVATACRQTESLKKTRPPRGLDKPNFPLKRAQFALQHKFGLILVITLNSNI